MQPHTHTINQSKATRRHLLTIRWTDKVQWTRMQQHNLLLKLNRKWSQSTRTRTTSSSISETMLTTPLRKMLFFWLMHSCPLATNVCWRTDCGVHCASRGLTNSAARSWTHFLFSSSCRLRLEHYGCICVLCCVVLCCVVMYSIV